MFDYFFDQYKLYPLFHLYLELTAVFFGLWSVWCAKKDSIWVFPTGIISTVIYTYLLWKWELLGDSMINAYYFVMSIYGWYFWTRKTSTTTIHRISYMTQKEKKTAVLIFMATLVFVVAVYFYFNKFTNWYCYIDTLLTGLFFVGMWLMAKRKIENWIFWIVGDLLSIPLYFVKGFIFTSFQYLIFTIIAFYGYFEWKKLIDNPSKGL